MSCLAMCAMHDDTSRVPDSSTVLHLVLLTADSWHCSLDLTCAVLPTVLTWCRAVLRADRAELCCADLVLCCAVRSGADSCAECADLVLC